jgi:predicted small lipoprotein YifL
MKKSYFLYFMLIIGLSGCGQPGPLYLPKNAPKVYDEPVAEPNKAKEEKATKPEPPPLPEKSKPTSEQ